ncbi:DUF4123 domain-containing protein [Ideonella sp.]|jgi:hypothetical protein|uniref:DUF4123 domain-containing protein n=1 Tax=Ideonella sp. TaxID=1929293 RepID=UPI0037BF760A
MTHDYLLADGSILHGLPLMQRLMDHPSAVALYDTQGPEAKLIGPWLVEASALPEWASLPPPLNLGLSLLSSVGTAADVLVHLRGLATVQTDDEQRFYLRYADTRVLQAMQMAWPEFLLARVKGPLLSWRWMDRFGEPQEFADGLRGVSAELPVLSLRQFEALINAGEPDRMAQMLGELRDERIQPLNNNAHYQWMKQALSWCDAQGFAHWTSRRAAACQTILSEGQVLQAQALETWIQTLSVDADPTGPLPPVHKA